MPVRKDRLQRDEVANLRRKIIDQLHDSLPNLNSELVTEGVVADALRWGGTRKEIDEDGKIMHIVRWLPRNLKHLSGPSTVRGQAPQEKLDPPSAVAYAVAIYLRPLTEPIIQKCRQHYWGSPLPPFPFSGNGIYLYDESRRDAYKWLDMQHQEDGGGTSQLILHLKTPTFLSSRQKVHSVIERLAIDKTYSTKDLELNILLKEVGTILNNDGSTMIVDKADEYSFSRVEFEWTGDVLGLHGFGKPVPIRSGGLLAQLHQAVRNLTQYSFWWTEGQALEYILLGHPPKPRGEQLQRYIFEGEDSPSSTNPAEVYAATEKRSGTLSTEKHWGLSQKTPPRQRTALSDTHLALLQLRFFQPHGKFSELLDQWDIWCSLDEYKSRLSSFRGVRGSTPYSRSGRLTQFRRELNRALIRALSFQPLPMGEDDRIQR